MLSFIDTACLIPGGYQAAGHTALGAILSRAEMKLTKLWLIATEVADAVQSWVLSSTHYFIALRNHSQS
jgi:hypothetical protein